MLAFNAAAVSASYRETDVTQYLLVFQLFSSMHFLLLCFVFKVCAQLFELHGR